MRGSALVAAVALLLAACGDSDDGDAAGTATTTSTSTSTTADGATTSTAGGAGSDGFAHTTVSTPPQTRGLLAAVRVGSHDGFDRVTFEFRDALPGYDVRRGEPPFMEDGSGDRVSVDGESFVMVLFEPASGYDTDANRPVYEGPRRVAGTGDITEVVRISDFEARLEWVVGSRGQGRFRVTSLEGPPRLVVDLARD